jgi:hypothetical protein
VSCEASALVGLYMRAQRVAGAHRGHGIEVRVDDVEVDDDEWRGEVCRAHGAGG